MKLWTSLLTVLILVLIAGLGVGGLKLYTLFGVGIPYLTLIIFTIGFINRLLKLGRQQSSPVNHDRLENHPGTPGMFKKMILEILFFRFFFGNLKMEKKESQGELGSSKWPWLGVFIFFGSLFIILLRHLRLFLNPVPSFIQGLESLDSFLQLGFPHNLIYVTDVVFLVALTYILLRRIFGSLVKNNSVAFNYFPIFLLLGSVLSGIVMSYFMRVNVVSVKELVMSIVTFRPLIPLDVGNILYIHIFLVSSLFIYLVLSPSEPMYQFNLSETGAEYRQQPPKA